jgi:hypothetical protein
VSTLRGSLVVVCGPPCLPDLGSQPAAVWHVDAFPRAQARTSAVDGSGARGAVSRSPWSRPVPSECLLYVPPRPPGAYGRRESGSGLRAISSSTTAILAAARAPVCCAARSGSGVRQPVGPATLRVRQQSHARGRPRATRCATIESDRRGRFSGRFRGSPATSGW